MGGDDFLSGRCLCEGVRFELLAAPEWVDHCHCRSCRRASGAPFLTWIGMADGAWHLHGEPAVFRSSAGTERGFCSTCGAVAFYRSDRYPGETHFPAALLDDPAAVTPGTHAHVDEALPWLHPSDGP